MSLLKKDTTKKRQIYKDVTKLDVNKNNGKYKVEAI